MNASELERLKTKMEGVLQNKAEEFHFFGYESVTPEEIWRCTLYVMNKKKVDMQLHQLASQLLNLRLTDFMNWLMLEAYKRDVKKEGGVNQQEKM
ncbi:hypothetical protein A374_11230 [Fictibacillus macauensis ZFHKF-1]|uniref:Post-transcriptional regulator n=1 Tax=Fictibacillus macauensis ZFHKF-1 TaxID=1196324 RepID=I8AHV5_9BACL|nr:post-transcriptional regulator [Fictibacillus macauensis]EIT85312.1 hypothetical protein A374_11230 [Fictibacillus macauensis ZFHKF-1]